MTDRTHGKLVRWNDNRGFGFIEPEDGSDDVFIHISALKTMARKPRSGDTIHYSLTVDDSGKTRAEDGIIEGVEERVLRSEVENTGGLPLPVNIVIWAFALYGAFTLITDLLA